MDQAIRRVPTKSMIGECISDIEHRREELHFRTESNRHFVLYHLEECCEDIWMDRIEGNTKDLIGEPIQVVVDNVEKNTALPGKQRRSHTWTHFTLETTNGKVVFHWVGVSDGQHRELPTFGEILD